MTMYAPFPGGDYQDAEQAFIAWKKYRHELGSDQYIVDTLIGLLHIVAEPQLAKKFATQPLLYMEPAMHIVQQVWELSNNIQGEYSDYPRRRGKMG